MFLTSLLGMLLQSKDPDGETFDVELLDEPLLEDEEEFVEISDQEVEEDSDSTAFVHLNEDARLIVADHSFVEDSFEKLSLRDAHDGIEVQIVHGSADIIRGIQKTVSESVGVLLARIDTMEEAVGDFEKKISESCTFKSKFEQKESQCRELVSSSFQTSRVGRSNMFYRRRRHWSCLKQNLSPENPMTPDQMNRRSGKLLILYLMIRARGRLLRKRLVSMMASTRNRPLSQHIKCS